MSWWSGLNPDIQEDSRERLAKNHFLDAVDSRTIREGINRARLINLDEAVRAALETENFERVEQQRVLDGKPPKIARGLDDDMPQRIEKMKDPLQVQADSLKVQADSLKVMADMMGRLSPDQPILVGHRIPAKRVNQRGRSRDCDERGHYARDCKEPPRKHVSEQGNSGQPSRGPARGLETKKAPKEGGQKSDDGRRVINLPKWTVNPWYGLYVNGFVRGYRVSVFD